MVLTRVDLPAPLSPTSPTTSPGATSKSTPSRACTAPNRLLTPLRARSGVLEFILSRPFLRRRGGPPRGRPAPRLSLLDPGRLARRLVGGRADLGHGPEVVLHDRVLDVVLGDRDRGQDHRRHALLAVVRVLVDQAGRRRLALGQRTGDLGGLLGLLRDRLVDGHEL